MSESFMTTAQARAVLAAAPADPEHPATKVAVKALMTATLAHVETAKEIAELVGEKYPPTAAEKLAAEKALAGIFMQRMNERAEGKV